MLHPLTFYTSPCLRSGNSLGLQCCLSVCPWKYSSTTASFMEPSWVLPSVCFQDTCGHLCPGACCDLSHIQFYAGLHLLTTCSFFGVEGEGHALSLFVVFNPGTLPPDGIRATLEKLAASDTGSCRWFVESPGLGLDLPVGQAVVDSGTSWIWVGVTASPMTVTN